MIAEVEQLDFFSRLPLPVEAAKKGLSWRSRMVEIALAVVHDRSCDRFLLLKRSENIDYPRWAFPGGKLDSGEGPKIAARRELVEETGLRLGHIKSQRLYQRCHPETKRLVHYVYFSVEPGKLRGQSARVVESSKSDAIEWVSWQTVKERFGTSLSDGLVKQLDVRTKGLGGKTIEQQELV